MGDLSRIPVYRGDTDDDASIHPHSRVGPAKPMSYQKYDHQIMEILNNSGQRDSEDDFDARARELNTGFQKFAESSPFESDCEGDLTHVEDEPDFGRVSGEFDASPKTRLLNKGGRKTFFSKKASL